MSNVRLTSYVSVRVVWCAIIAATAQAQQVADTSYRPVVQAPAYAAGKGPTVFLDEAHANFHRVDGRYAPFAGAAAKLAEAFGVLFGDGFAADSGENTGPMRFRRSDGSLGAHPIVDGRSPMERVDSLTSFTGQAFRLMAPGQPIMTLPRGTVLLLPEEAWLFSKRSPRIRADGMLQGAALEVGRGRVVMLGEAAMMTAQVQGPQRTLMGMNNPAAAQNAQFALNIVRWLARLY